MQENDQSDNENDASIDRHDVTIEAAPRTTWWALKDDLILLTQANTDRPFMAERGLMAAWDATAESISQAPEFGRPGINGKKASSRFSKLLEAHRLYKKQAKSLSGSPENDTPKIKLLDEIVAAIDNHNKAKTKEIMSKKTARSEPYEPARLVRESAPAARAPKRPRTSIATSDDDDDDDPAPKTTDAAFQLRVMEIELERERIALEKTKLQMQADQNDKDRAERAAIREMDAKHSSDMMTMMKALLEQMQARKNYQV